MLIWALNRVLAVYYTNSWNTSYIPINTNSAYDNTGVPYNVSLILNEHNLFDEAGFQAYSEPWMSAGFVISYLWYFALYSASKFFVPKTFFRRLIRHLQHSPTSLSSTDMTLLPEAEESGRA